MTRWRMPPEWAPHDATWIAWPHHEPDWPRKLAPVQWAYAEIVRVLAKHERVEVLCQSHDVRESAAEMLRAHDVDMRRVNLPIVPTDRVWLRDSGPIFAWKADTGEVELLAFAFNAWAKYDNFTRDEKVPGAVQELTGLPMTCPLRPDSPERLVLEGGGIDVNGEGRIMVTEEWLLSDTQVRNPGMSRADYERAFATYLGCTDTIWLGRGCVGDDTHGHIDDVARFVGPDLVLLAYEEDPADENHEMSVDNLARLRAAAARRPLDVVLLPFPRAVIMDGQRLPASYANFYIANGVVVVPTFNDANDRLALDIIARVFPDRRVIGVHAVDLVWGLGTLHCLTQQQPAMAIRTGGVA